MRLNIVRVAHSVEGPRDAPIHSKSAPKVSPDVSKVRLLRSEEEEVAPHTCSHDWLHNSLPTIVCELCCLKTGSSVLVLSSCAFTSSLPATLSRGLVILR